MACLRCVVSFAGPAAAQRRKIPRHTSRAALAPHACTAHLPTGVRPHGPRHRCSLPLPAGCRWAGRVIDCSECRHAPVTHLVTACTSLRAPNMCALMCRTLVVTAQQVDDRTGPPIATRELDRHGIVERAALGGRMSARPGRLADGRRRCIARLEPAPALPARALLPLRPRADACAACACLADGRGQRGREAAAVVTIAAPQPAAATTTARRRREVSNVKRLYSLLRVEQTQQ